MVFHNQDDDISPAIDYFGKVLKQTGFTRNLVHIGPLIRREEEYVHMTVPERIRILRKMMTFVSKANIMHESFYVEKKHIGDEPELAEKLAKQIAEFIKQNFPYFMSFDKVKIYYDNGQIEITKIIISVFTTLLSNVELKKAYQKDYRLSQVADLICSAKLTELKMNAKILSRSERRVLGSDRDIHRIMLKPLERKKFRG